MKSNLLFDFLVNKENCTLTIVREFNAERQLVWDCYTKQELLEQWFAPKPFSIKTKSMDFKNGGHWHYAMVSPEGDEFWGYTEYFGVSPVNSYNTKDGFCDSEGKINEDLPRANWNVTFTDKGERTVVSTIVTYDSLNDLEAVINMGMKEGLTLTLEQLDKLLGDLKE